MIIRTRLLRIAATVSSAALVIGLSGVSGLGTTASASGCSTSTALPWQSPPSGFDPHRRPGAKVYRHWVRPCGFSHAFYNFDYDTNKSRADNPVTIIFVSNHAGLVGRVYSELQLQGVDGRGSNMQMQGFGWSRSGIAGNEHWTSYAAGRKDPPGTCWGHCGSGVDIHLRAYGPSGREGTQIYQSSGRWHYYAPATVHFDIDEGSSTYAHFGYSDHARQILVDHMVAAGKWRLVGSVWVNNACRHWVYHDQYCNSNGWAVLVEA